MRKISIIVVLSLVLVFGLAMNALAFTITSLVPTDTNYSVSVSGNNVKEDYNATSLVPTTSLGFTSHDGNAVIDIIGGVQTFFDKLVTLAANDIKTNLEITWDIKNTSPFTWSDYHFFLLAAAPKFTKAQSADFKDATFTDFTATFNAVGPGSKEIAPGDTLHLNVALDTSALTSGFNFQLRQIATAVPVPSSILLMSSGLLGLIGLGWRRRN